MFALLNFFWDANAPVAPPDIIVPDSTPGRGSGKGRGKNHLDHYRTFDDDYWLERETVLKPDAPKAVHFVEPTDNRLSPSQLMEAKMQLANLRQALTQAVSVEALKQIAKQIASLKAEIASA